MGNSIFNYANEKLTFFINDMSEHQLIFFDLDDSRFIPFRKEERETFGKNAVESSDFQSVLEFDDFKDLCERIISMWMRAM